jgi:ABC-type multidrug transport system fused ATPase/permease subunit
MKIFKTIFGAKNTNLFFILILLSFVASLFEVFSIGLIIPLIDILLNDNFENYPDYIISFIKFFSIDNYNKLFLYVFSFIIIIFILRFIIFLLSDFSKVYFSTKIRKEIQQKLFKNYILQDYNFFFINGSPKLVKNIINETLIYSDKYVFAILNLISDSLILVLILLMLLYFNFKITIGILLIVGFLSFLYFSYSIKIINFLIKKRCIDESLLFKKLSESFSNIKDIKIYNIYDYIFTSTEKLINNYVKNYRKLYQLQIVPKPLFEFILILAFLILSLVSIFFFNVPKKEILSTFALFGAAAFRMVPAFSRIINYLQDIKFSNNSKKILYKDLFNNKLEKYIPENNSINYQNDKKKPIFSKIIIKDLNLQYNSNIIFKNVNLEINKNKIFGIVGESGAGKSSLINIILGLIKASSGSIKYVFDDKIINTAPTNFFSYVPQDIFLLDDSILKNIAFGLDEKDIDFKRIDEIIDKVDLRKFINNLEDGIYTVVGDSSNLISGGQAQRISLARALYHKSEVLILDEFTNQLDVNTEKKIIDLIKKLKKERTIIMVSHKTNPLSICDEVFKIN